MKGKDAFTQGEASRIKKLIREKLQSDTNGQKRIRDKIRSLGFYITDFSNKKRFDTDDFDKYAKIID